MIKPTPGGAQSVHKAVSVLKYVAAGTNNGARLLDITEGVGLERPTVHRLLQALVREGLVIQDKSHKYHLGPLIFELHVMSGGFFNIVEGCRPILQRLAEETGDAAFFFLRDGSEAVCAAREQGSYYIQTPVVAVNDRHPLGVSAGGLAILCGMPEKSALAALDLVGPRLEANYGLTREEVWNCYQEASKSGVAAIAGRAAPGVKGIGVPIYGELDVPFAAVTLATITDRMTEERIRTIAPMLQTAAKMIEAILRPKSLE